MKTALSYNQVNLALELVQSLRVFRVCLHFDVSKNVLISGDDDVEGRKGRLSEGTTI